MRDKRSRESDFFYFLLYSTEMKKWPLLSKFSFTRKDMYLSVTGIIFGTCLGVGLLSFMVPGAVQAIVLYNKEKRLIADIKSGKQEMPGDMWLSHAKSFKSKSDNEYVSDMINMNNSVILMNKRLQLGVYASTPELKQFGDLVAKERAKEILLLQKFNSTFNTE